MDVYRFLQVLAVANICFISLTFVAANDSNEIVINKHKQDDLLSVYLVNDNDASISDTLAKSVLGYQTEDIPLEKLLEVDGIGILHKQELFSQFNHGHMSEVDKIFDLLVSAPTYNDFIKRASILKSQVNRSLLLYAIHKSLLFRNDTQDVQAPPLWQVSARSFFTHEEITSAISRARSLPTSTDHEIPLSRAGSPRNPESKLSWFREDIQLSTMHYMLSMVVHNSNDAHVQLKAMNGYRSYLYSSLMARYNAERQALNMAPVQPLDFNEVISEGYDSHLSIPSGISMFAPRRPEMRLKDNERNHEEDQTIAKLQQMTRKLEEAILMGFMIQNDGTKIKTTPLNLFRALIGSYGEEKLDKVYGEGHHLYEHEILAAISDPEGKNGQNLGVLGTVETAMRDPVFYRLHAGTYIINRFYENLKPYSETELEFPDVEIRDVKLIPSETHRGELKENVLKTYLETVEVDIQYDRTVASHVTPGTPIMVGTEKLNHDSFMYRINVNNNNVNPVSAAVRIFMAPSLDWRTDKPFRSLIEQRESFFEMDKFVIQLHHGENIIERLDTQSWDMSPPLLSVEDLMTEGMVKNRRSGCRWPQNLAIPRGTPEGVQFDVLVMITDWERDQEAMPLDSTGGPNPCGIMSDTDRRVTLYPFERKLQQDVADYLMKQAKNVFVTKVKIVHDGKR